MKSKLVAAFEYEGTPAPMEGFFIGELLIGAAKHKKLEELGLDQCRNCGAIFKLPKQTVKIVIPHKSSLSADFGVVGPLPYLSKRLRDLIGPDLEEHTTVLEIVFPDGRSAKDSYAVLAKRSVLIRGDGNSTLERCMKCGRRTYHPTGDRYVLTKDLTRPVLGAGHRLIVDEAAYARIRGIRLRKSEILPLSVRSKPFDEWPAALPVFGPKGK